MGLSSFRREGTTEYASHTLEGNWQEERSRLEVGEKVRLSLMEGAVVAPLDPDLSIAPPTRVPGAKSDGRLLIPDRMTRSRTTNDSSRQGADDGFREYTSMNQTFYTGQLPDGEEKVAKKLISLDTFHYALDERPTAGPTNGGFGSILPRHLPSHSERMLETTAMASWR